VGFVVGVTKYIGPFVLTLTQLYQKRKFCQEFFITSPLFVEIFGYNHFWNHEDFERKLTAIEFHLLRFFYLELDKQV
jgi:hypothetical protein